jgi:hypothetical protein
LTQIVAVLVIGFVTVRAGTFLIPSGEINPVNKMIPVTQSHLRSLPGAMTVVMNDPATLGF